MRQKRHSKSDSMIFSYLASNNFLKVIIGGLAGIIVTACTVAWTMSSTWSNTQNSVSDHEKRLIKVEANQEINSKEHTEIRELMVQAITQIKNLTEAQKDSLQDIRDIRAMVK